MLILLMCRHTVISRGEYSPPEQAYLSTLREDTILTSGPAVIVHINLVRLLSSSVSRRFADLSIDSWGNSRCNLALLSPRGGLEDEICWSHKHSLPRKVWHSTDRSSSSDAHHGGRLKPKSTLK